MQTYEMTCKQFKIIDAALFPGMNYLQRLKSGMERAKFPVNDETYLLFSKAYEAALALKKHTEAESRIQRVGRSPRKEE